MLEGFLKLMLVVMIGIVAILTIAGALLGWLTGTPLVVAIPVGAIIGAVLAGALAVWGLWYRKNSSHPADEQA